MSSLHNDAEWAVLTACCSATNDECQRRSVLAALDGQFDPKKLLLLARRHRVEGLLYNGLEAAGVALAGGQWVNLSTRAKQIRFASIQYAMEEARLTLLFNAAGLDGLFVKGATAAMLAYGTVTLKSSRDVDMLIPVTQRDASFEALAAAGYVLQIDGYDGDPRALSRYTAGHKETVWIGRTNGLCVELHTALTDIPGLIPGIGVKSPRQKVVLPGDVEVATLATPHLLAYMAVHGTIHGWQRLKWLADATHLLARSEMDPQHFLDEAAALGAGRAANVMLTLAARHLDSSLDQFSNRGSRTTKWLVDLSEIVMTSNSLAPADSPINGKLADFINFALIESLLAPGIFNGFLRLWGLLGRPYHADHLKLPRWLLRPYMVVWLSARALTRPWRRSHREGSAG